MEKALPNIGHMGKYLSSYQDVILPNFNTLFHKVNFMINELYALSEMRYPDSVYEALCLYPAVLQSTSSCLEGILTFEEIQKLSSDTPAITEIFAKTAKRFYSEDLTETDVTKKVKKINELSNPNKSSKYSLEQYADKIILLDCVYDLFYPESKSPLVSINETIRRMAILRSLKTRYPDEYLYAKKQAIKLIIENVAVLEKQIAPEEKEQNLFTLLVASSVSTRASFCASRPEKLMKINLNSQFDFACPAIDNQMSRRIRLLFNVAEEAGKPISAKDLSFVLGALIEISSDEETAKSKRKGSIPNVLHQLVTYVFREKKDNLTEALPLILAHTPSVKWMENTHQGFLKYLSERLEQGKAMQTERQCIAHQNKNLGNNDRSLQKS